VLKLYVLVAFLLGRCNLLRENIQERIFIAVFLFSRTYQLYFIWCWVERFLLMFVVMRSCKTISVESHVYPASTTPSLLWKFIHSYNMDTSTTSTVWPRRVVCRTLFVYGVLLVVGNAVAVLFFPIAIHLPHSRIVISLTRSQTINFSWK